MKKGGIAHPLLKPQMEATYFFFFAAFLAAFLAAMVCNPPFRSRYCQPCFQHFVLTTRACTSWSVGNDLHIVKTFWDFSIVASPFISAS